jgi:uncharacterized protein YbjT (DUF2867 family)
MTTTGAAVLVTGATGTVGRAVVAELLATGQRVRAGVREPGAPDLPADAEHVHLDFADPATAGPALEGVDRLFLMRPPAISDVRTAMGPVVRAAAAVGVRRVVVLSVMGVNPALPHWQLERMVRTAGLPSTALRPAYFAQNLITAFGAGIRDSSQLRLAAGAGRVSFVDTRDVAAVAARVLTDPVSYPQAALTLTGPAALTFGDAAELLGAELGRPVAYVRQSLLEHRRELLTQGAESAYAWVQLVIDVTTRLGLAGKVTRDVPDVLGRPAISLAAFVHDHRETWL